MKVSIVVEGDVTAPPVRVVLLLLVYRPRRLCGQEMHQRRQQLFSPSFFLQTYKVAQFNVSLFKTSCRQTRVRTGDQTGIKVKLIVRKEKHIYSEDMQEIS